jgi:UDP-N-acetylglucosamine acyltransferase
MPEIHPTAILDGDITLDESVTIGPHCVLSGTISIGADTKLIGSSYLTGTLSIGTGNTIYPTAHIGFAAQDICFPHNQFDPGISIGNNNIFREGTTIHRATQDIATTIGNDNVFMTNSHVGHDCQIGNNNTIVSGVLLAGHVHVRNNVTIGGGTSIHQFVTIGSGAMLCGASFATYDVPPFFMLTGGNIVGSVNIIGMRRSGMDIAEIDRRKEIYKLLYRGGGIINSYLGKLRSDGDEIAIEYADFIDSSRRGIIAPYHTKRSARRGLTVTNE